MSICCRCPLCLSPPGHPHAEGCPADLGPPRRPSLVALAIVPVEVLPAAFTAEEIGAWGRSGPLRSLGYRPKDDTEP